MAEKLEDLNLPVASVQKIIKDALPENINIGKDVRAALSRAAAVFILYITGQATQIAHNSNRKTLAGQDIYDALEETEFEDFIPKIKNALQIAKENKLKKDTSKNKKNDDEDMDDEEEDEEKDDV